MSGEAGKGSLPRKVDMEKWEKSPLWKRGGRRKKINDEERLRGRIQNGAKRAEEFENALKHLREGK